MEADASWIAIARVTLQRLGVPRASIEYDDALSSALWAMFRARCRNPDADLWDGAWQGAMDGIRHSTGYRRVHKASKARTVSIEVAFDGAAETLVAAPESEPDPYPSVAELLERFPPGPHHPGHARAPTDPRSHNQIIRSYLAGETQAHIGARLGVLESRINQIIAKWTGDVRGAVPVLLAEVNGG